jgi:hypothetical protein
LSGWNKEHHTQGLQGFDLIPTWDLRSATYNSQFIKFSDKEGQDHDKQPLDTFDAEEQQIMNQFNPQGKWPFVYINGEYTKIGPGYSPKLIDGKTFDDVYSELQSGQKTDASNGINTEAANITALICSATGGQPEAVCK